MTQQSTRPSSRPPLAGSLASEGVKLRTLPINSLLSLVAVISIIGTGGMLAASLLTRLSDPQFAGETVAAVPLQFVDSVLWAQLIVAVIAVLAVTNEYSSGEVRLSLLALPARWPWLAGKSIVLALRGFLIGVFGAGGSLGLSALLLSGSEVAYDLGIAEAVSLTLRSGLYLAAIAVFSVSVATVVRHVVAALIAVLVLLVVLPPLLSSIAALEITADFTPTYAGRRIISDFPTLAELSPWAGFGVLLLWVVVATVGAASLLKVRDV